MASAPLQSEPDAPAPPKSKKRHRQFDTSTKRGIKKQAKEDIRYLKWEQKEASRQKKEAAKQIKIQKKTEARRRKEEEKRAVSENRAAKKEQKKKGGFQEGRLICHGKPRFPEKAKERPDLGGLSSGGKKSKNGIVYTTDGRYVKILEIEPINFLLRSAREQQGIIYSFISYLKISPDQTPDQDDSPKKQTSISIWSSPSWSWSGKPIPTVRNCSVTTSSLSRT